MHGKGRAAQLLPVKKWTDYPANWEKRRLSMVAEVQRLSICGVGHQDRKVQISADHAVKLSWRTNKKKKMTNGGRARKKFHLKCATATHVRSHETQRRYNCIQNCLCSFETRNGTFSKRSKKLRFPIRKAPAGWRSVWCCYAASGARRRKRRTCQISNVTSSASRQWAQGTSISSWLFV